MKTPPMILLIGPSGSGKTTIASFLNLRNGWRSIESYTTRSPRYEGEEGHTFISDAEFDKLTDLVAYTEYNNHRYGCTSKQIDEHEIYVVDIPGVETLLANYKGSKKFLAVYLDVPADERQSRMAERGDGETKIHDRLSNDADAFMDASDKLKELLGDENVLVVASRFSVDTTLLIEEHLINKGYEWETI